MIMRSAQQAANIWNDGKRFLRTYMALWRLNLRQVDLCCDLFDFLASDGTLLYAYWTLCRLQVCQEWQTPLAHAAKSTRN